MGVQTLARYFGGLLIAAATSALAAQAASPNRALIVPPKGLHRIAHDPRFAKQLHTMDHAKLVVEYRGYVHPKAGNVILARSVILGVGSIPNTLQITARDWGNAMAQVLSRRPQLKMLAAKPITLCGGQPGWLNVFAPLRTDIVYEIANASGAQAMYVAVLIRPTSIPDSLKTEQSLYTLCPPDAPQASSDAARVLPFSVPAGWSSGSVDLIQAGPPLIKKGVWLQLGTGKPMPDSLMLYQAPNLSQDDTPDDRIASIIDQTQQNVPGFEQKSSQPQKLCGGSEDGWLLEYAALDSHSHKVFVESMYAFGSDTSYILNYVRNYGDREDSQARVALNSLCASNQAPR